jgi:hypothetical protein
MPCDANDDCARCTTLSGLPPGTVCASSADCGGARCSVGDVGVLCTSNDGCTVEGDLVPGGACCDGETGLCYDGTSPSPNTITGPADCDGPQQVYSAGKLCEFEPPCIEHTGACCDHTPVVDGDAAGVCVDDADQEDDCTGAQLTWHKGESCSAVTCLEDLGGCCNTLTGICSTTTIDDCQGAQRTWTKGDDTCAGTPCVAITGACCDGDVFGSCTQTLSADCVGGKREWHKGRTCAELDPPCTHNTIPTVSEWGLVVLTLLLLTGAKVYFGRRQSATA